MTVFYSFTAANNIIKKTDRATNLCADHGEQRDDRVGQPRDVEGDGHDEKHQRRVTLSYQGRVTLRRLRSEV